jgi:transcriptional regulator with XRE-family HTH domain
MDSKRAAALGTVVGIRRELGLSQSELAGLLGMSSRAVQSYEQGWRHPSPAAQRLLLLLLIAQRRGISFPTQCCWKAMDCRSELRDRCAAYRSRQGHLCWFLTGTFCAGERTKTWAEKWRKCRRCSFMRDLLRKSS